MPPLPLVPAQPTLKQLARDVDAMRLEGGLAQSISWPDSIGWGRSDRHQLALRRFTFGMVVDGSLT
jgi:hypothetical protein